MPTLAAELVIQTKVRDKLNNSCVHCWLFVLVERFWNSFKLFIRKVLLCRKYLFNWEISSFCVILALAFVRLRTYETRLITKRHS